MTVSYDRDHRIDQLTRAQIVAILEGPGGYQCYDHEATEDLRENLRKDIDDGILPESVLETA